MTFDTELVIQFLTWFVSAGAGILAYWLLARPILIAVLAGWAGWTEPNLAISLALLKRLAAGVLGLVLSLAGYLVMAGLGFAQMPAGMLGWLGLIITMTGLHFPISQLIHGVRDLNPDHLQGR
jgi:hypothetical protein